MSQNGENRIKNVVGPHRIFPGRLSVSRSFGDIAAKLVAKGGNP
jgi:protein phosphatase 2C family protein 2/3